MKKNYLFLSVGITFLFLALFLIPCFYFRLSTDDIYFLHEVENKSLYQSVLNTYLKWSGRFATFTLQNFIYKIFYNRVAYFFLFPLLTFVTLFCGIYKNVHQLCLHSNFKINRLTKYVLSLSFMSLLFFLSYDIGEIWFWPACIVGYLMSIVAVTWGFFFIIRPGNQLIDYTFICICSLFTGGSCELYTPFFLFILAYAIVHRYKQSPSLSIYLEHEFHRKLLIAFLFLFISYALLFVSPGNYLRNALLPKHQVLFSFFITGKSLIKFFILFIPGHLHFIFAFSFVFLIIGSDFRSKCNYRFKISFREFVKKASIFFFLFSVVYFYLIAYVLSETGPARLWFLVSFVFSILVCCIVFYAGYSQLLSPRQTTILKKVSMIVSFLILIMLLIQQYSITKTYALAYDERKKFLQGLNDHLKADTVIRVPALPPPGMLYGAEITADTNHYTNQHLRLGYNLNYQIIKN